MKVYIGLTMSLIFMIQIKVFANAVVLNSGCSGVLFKMAGMKNDHIAYVLTDGHCLSIGQLKVTCNDLAQKGFKIYTAAPDLPAEGMTLVFDSFARDVTSTCEVEQKVSKLKEGPWTWKTFFRMKSDSHCAFVHGESGTVGVEPTIGLVYALAQTIYEGGQACTFDNPCEISDQGAITVASMSQGYAVPVAPLYGCYDKTKAEFNFTLPTCKINSR